ncbi:MAG TPA: c-type cytochrome, partial [Mariprofundaceae bacterium]|nr:c-type cytochrome [Mariprofundaceae bacterium]
KPAASTAMTPKPAAPAPTPAPAPKPAAMAATNPFNTNKCAACHAIDQDKVGPAWKTVVEKYGDAATLAKDFESGFKERRVANSIAKWKPKEGLMTSQFNSLIKGHEKEAAHALFESVKNGKFGSY